MKYYILEISEEVSNFGFQINLPDYYEYDIKNSLYKINDENFKEYTPFFPIFNYKHLFPITDIIKHVFTRKLIISNLFKDSLKGLNLPEHKLYPVTINYNTQNLEYNFLYFKGESPSFITFPGSKYIISNGLGEKKEIEFKSIYEYYQFIDIEKNSYSEPAENDGMPKIGALKEILNHKKNTWRIVRPTEYLIKKENLMTRDLFKLPRDINIYVSERFVEKMNIRGITGLDFKLTGKIKNDYYH
ncbi:MAG: hypothetical protein R3C61_20875 [Bacteroidia bacterium]